MMTDLTGQFNKVVMVTIYKNLAAFEQNFQKYMVDTEETRKMKEIMKGYQDMNFTSSRERYHICNFLLPCCFLMFQTEQSRFLEFTPNDAQLMCDKEKVFPSAVQ
jgi:hypothetical protein